MPTRLFPGRLKVGRVVTGSQEWDRRRLQILLAVTGLVAVALAYGVVWSTISMVRDHGQAQPGASGEHHAAASDTQATRAEDFTPGPLSTDAAPSMALPQVATLGAAQVPTGFPRTAHGALAQLIAIDQRAIESASLVTAQHVIGAWAAPDGPTPSSWSGVKAVAVILETAGLPATSSTVLHLELSPTMGLIRDPSAGRAGAQVTPCVDFVMTTSVPPGTPSQVAVADCQHMVWQRGRWLIGPGPEADPGPSLWPGTQASYDAGYEWLEVSP
jgi:hypothetical protein